MRWGESSDPTVPNLVNARTVLSGLESIIKLIFAFLILAK